MGRVRHVVMVAPFALAWLLASAAGIALLVMGEAWAVFGMLVVCLILTGGVAVYAAYSEAMDHAEEAAE